MADEYKDLIDKNALQGYHKDMKSYVDGKTDAIQQKINQLMSDNEFNTATYVESQLDPKPTAQYGDKSTLRRRYPYLIDTTKINDDNQVYGVRRLKLDNLFRYADTNQIAPVVGISEEQRAECDVELYLDNAQKTKYCEAGEFDALEFYEKYGVSQKLYDVDGNEVRVLRPWETTSTDLSIYYAFADKFGNPTAVTVLDNIKGESGKLWRGILPDGVKTWDGVDVSKWRLEATGFSPCPVTTIKGKARCFMYVHNPNTGSELTNTRGYKGNNNICDIFLDTGFMFPRTGDVTQLTMMDYARSQNPDKTSPLPFAEGGYHALNAMLIADELRMGTKAVHSASLFGSGISSNDTCNSEATWLANGGCRYRLSGDENWKYINWNGSPVFCYNKNGKKTNMSDALNSYNPKAYCMEGEMAASYATELGIAENTEFEFYGNKYWYVNVDGGVALLDGGMDIRLYSIRQGIINAYDADGNEQTYDVECNLRISLVGGINECGDIYAYCGGGHELVATNTDEGITSGALGVSDVTAFVQPDQSKWVYDKTLFLDNLGTFGFEESYIQAGSIRNISTYVREHYPNTVLPKVTGSGVLTGEGHYLYNNNYWYTNYLRRTRLGSRFRGYANAASCSARYCTALYSAGAPSSPHGGLALVCLAGATQSQ